MEPVTPNVERRGPMIRDIIQCSGMIAGILAGTLAIWTVLALRGRTALWRCHVHRGFPAGFLIWATAYWWGWYGLLAAFPTYGLVALAFWLDTRKQFSKN